jgi:hypothetical protein
MQPWKRQEVHSKVWSNNVNGSYQLGEANVTMVDSLHYHCPFSEVDFIYTTFRELAVFPSSGDRLSLY